MMPEHQPQPPKPDADAATLRIGCVSYLNAKPLIDGLEDHADLRVRYDVPARLFDDLATGDVDIALCPVADLHREKVELQIVPVGGIASEGATLTVRLFSRVPIESITHIHADTESHTSVMLLRVLMHHLFGSSPTLIDYHARENVADGKLVEDAQAMLLIGDKVVTDSPLAVHYPHQLDLGEAWHAWTGLPFVFAVWAARKDTNLRDLPQQLDATRKLNAGRIKHIAAQHAPAHGWSIDLAEEYLGRILKYEVGPREFEAIERFTEAADALGLLAQRQPIRLYPL